MDKQLNEIAQIAGDFKLLKRSGWVFHKVKNPESVADHSWGLSFLVMLYTPKHLDKLKCLELAIIHDLAEIEVGDITPRDGVSSIEKNKLEMLAMEKIVNRIGTPPPPTTTSPIFLSYFKNWRSKKRRNLNLSSNWIKLKLFCKLIIMPLMDLWSQSFIKNFTILQKTKSICLTYGNCSANLYPIIKIS